MDTTINFTGMVSWQQFKRAQWTHLGARWLGLLLVPAALIGYAWFAGVTWSPALWAVVLVVSAGFVPLMLAVSVLAWRRTYTKSPYLQQPFSGSASRDTFLIEGRTGRTEMRWDEFVRIREGRGVLLLYRGPNLFNVVAREWFESDDAWDAVRRFARGALSR